MKLTKLLTVLAAACMLLPLSAFAADYPTKPVQVIVPAAPGGDTDFNARLMSKFMSKHIGKQLVVVNVSGAGGSTGTTRVKDASPDGYTVLFFHPSVLLNQVFGVTKYGIADFDMAALPILDSTNSFVVRADSRFKNLKDLAAEIKAKPDTVNYAAETGGLVYVNGVMFTTLAGGRFNIVDVGSQAPKNAALMGGQIDLTAVPANGIKGFLDSKKFRLLGIMAEERHPAYPDVPTFKEQGFNVVNPKPYFFAFPKGTPKDVIEAFNVAVRKALKDPECVELMKNNNLTATSMETDKALKFMQNMQTDFQKAVDASKAAK